MPKEEIFHKFKMGTLRSSSGDKVKSRKQAIAIALSYADGGHKKQPNKWKGKK